ncbi:MAG: DUF6524 family protein [Magnetospirillum sp. WYHS-4]
MEPTGRLAILAWPAALRNIPAAMAATPPFTLPQFLLRWLSSVFVVFLTYNPFHYSFWHWVSEPEGGDIMLKAVVSVALFIVYVFMVWVVLASLGIWGVGAGALIGILAAVEILDLLPESSRSRIVVELIALLCVATFFGIGLAWPHIATRLSGQVQKRYLVKIKKPWA